MLGCAYFASLLWGWTACGPVRSGLCACVLVSFGSAFVNRWGVEGRASEREMDAQVEEAAWGRGEGFHVLFQIMMYSEASVGLDEQPDQRLFCPEATLCLGVGGVVSEWEALPGWKLSSARGGQRLQAGSRRLRFPPHSGFVHFWSVSRVRPPGSAGEARKRQWAHSPGLAPRVGTFGIISKEHFSTPSPGERHSRVGQVPVTSMTGTGLHGGTGSVLP